VNVFYESMMERLGQLLERINEYLSSQPWQVLVELVVIWVVVYVIMRFLRGTRGARVIKGLALLLIIVTLSLQIFGQGDTFPRLAVLLTNFLTIVTLVLVIVFQPELRRALVRLGEARFFRQTGLRKARVVEELMAAVEYMSRNKIGALIAVERQVGLRGIVEMGTQLDSQVSRELVQTIFWPGSALHDMGLVIRGDRMVAAGVQFPLAEGEHIPQELGSRHRAAMGLSQEVDALIIVVSEETGTISIAERGQLTRGLSMADLRPILTRGLSKISIDNLENALNGDEEVAAISGKS
jgi:diadenylate cyclase